MTRLALLVSIVGFGAGCGQSVDEYPISPGAGGTGVIGAQPSGATLTGRVCMVADPRVLDTCSSTGAAGLAVTMAGATTTTAADGTFALPMAGSGSGSAGSGSAAAPAMVGVSGPGIVSTQIAAATGVSIPVLNETLFAQMTAANGIPPMSGTGSILATVTRDGQPVSGVTVTASPASQFLPRFDGSTPTAFQLDETGERGVIWVPGVALGPTQLTFDDVASSGSTTVDGVRVIDGGITIMSAVLP